MCDVQDSDAPATITTSRWVACIPAHFTPGQRVEVDAVRRTLEMGGTLAFKVLGPVCVAWLLPARGDGRRADLEVARWVRDTTRDLVEVNGPKPRT